MHFNGYTILHQRGMSEQQTIDDEWGGVFDVDVLNLLKSLKLR